MLQVRLTGNHFREFMLFLDIIGINAYRLNMLAVEQPARKVWTEEEISQLPDNGYNVEVVDGELRMSPKNNRLHGTVCSKLSMYMALHAMQNRLGEVCDSNTGFWMTNGNLRAPD